MSKTNLIGEFECKVDDKSRVILPSGLKKQISQEAQERFVINRGFEGCLVLYPMNVWKETTAKIDKLNLLCATTASLYGSLQRCHRTCPRQSEQALIAKVAAGICGN